MQDVRGQAVGKRALEIAAAGAHNLMFFGPPGSGKTMLARRLSTILPELAFDEALETTTVYSVAGPMPSSGLMTARPFRAPHHTVSSAGLIGGGPAARPGEITLAHNGVLFLDELLEFQRGVLEAMRQPLEEGQVTIARARRSVTFPSRFMLVAALNPCPCGFWGSTRRTCTCSEQKLSAYRNRLSGPLLDRLDLHVEMPDPHYAELARAPQGESSATIRERVKNARKRQLARASCPNALLSAGQLDRYAPLPPSAHKMLEKAMDRFGLSARAIARVRRIALTVADLEGADQIAPEHIAESLGFRLWDRCA